MTAPQVPPCVGRAELPNPCGEHANIRSIRGKIRAHNKPPAAYLPVRWLRALTDQEGIG